MTGIVLLFGITADPFELYTQSGIQSAYAMDNDEDDDDGGCADDDDDGNDDGNDDNDGDSSDEDDAGDTSVSKNTGPIHGAGADGDDDGGADDDDDCVGGSGMSIDKSALLVSGFQTHGSWMIPVLLAALGLGIVVARKL